MRNNVIIYLLKARLLHKVVKYAYRYKGLSYVFKVLRGKYEKETIAFAFTWEDTTEGYTYWAEQDEKMIKYYSKR